MEKVGISTDCQGPFGILRSSRGGTSQWTPLSVGAEQRDQIALARIGFSPSESAPFSSPFLRKDQRQFFKVFLFLGGGYFPPVKLFIGVPDLWSVVRVFLPPQLIVQKGALRGVPRQFFRLFRPLFSNFSHCMSMKKRTDPLSPPGVFLVDT